jgi:hypothetical protein
MMNSKKNKGWAADEFSTVDLGDKRLNKRLIKLCDRFSDSPESPINQACEDWGESKAAYRFFQNEKVDCDQILSSHQAKTLERACDRQVVLAVQDTSYFIYTNHYKTEGLGKISTTKGRHGGETHSRGLVMHTCMALTTNGLPLGLLDLKITARENTNKEKKRGANINLPIEEKESYRWLETLRKTHDLMGEKQVVAVCDRESDIYDFFKLSKELNAPVLIRANPNRKVNRKSRYEQKDLTKLREFLLEKSESGSYQINVPRKAKSKQSPERLGRNAVLTIRFAPFQMNPPRNHIKHKTEKLPDIEMNAIHVLEENPPEGEEAIEWMLLTNLSITSFEQAYEKVLWYGFRWRIEMFFKVLKSGFKVEDCRLAHADRLQRYLTIMSIVAWRIFMITLIARTNPDLSCSNFLSRHEWQVLYLKVAKGKDIPDTPPTMSEAVVWIAKLGGYLGRKNDGPPGTLTFWRGWKRLGDLTEGQNLASKFL